MRSAITGLIVQSHTKKQMEYKWDRFCNRCFNRLKDTAINCDHCGSDFVKKHIVISEIHKKTPDFKIRKQWIGRTGEYIIDTDFGLVKNTPIEAGWYGGYFISDEPPHDVWLLNANNLRSPDRGTEHGRRQN
jgi:hypothetical protein